MPPAISTEEEAEDELLLQVLDVDCDADSSDGDSTAGLPGATSASSSSSSSAAAAAWKQHWRRCYRQMVGKRRAVAARDWRGLLHLLLLPVLAVAMVLTVLRLNIDPTNPSIQLTLDRWAAACSP